MCTNAADALNASTISKTSAMGTESVVPDGAASASVVNAMQPFDQYRLHLYNYALQAERLRFVQNYAPVAAAAAAAAATGPVCPTFASPYGPRWPFAAMSLFQNRLTADEPKPQHSYIGLIAMAILSSPESKLVLSDIYQYILDNYPYFRSRGPGWRNSIRHNLSLNDCFIKAGRSANGKGHYWAIHPANIDDFKKGDFRRRKAQRKVRKHMGLAVDDDGNDSPSPPPLTPPPSLWPTAPAIVFPATFPTSISRKRQFDVASLLAPDDDSIKKKRSVQCSPSSSGEEEDDPGVDIDVTGGCGSGELNTGLSTTESPLRDEGCASNSSSNSLTAASPWCYSTVLQGTSPSSASSSPEHQQLVAKYYEQLNHARTIQLYQQLQMQRRFCNVDAESAARIEELENNG